MANKKFSIGIDFGATAVKAALVNREGKIIIKSVIPTKRCKKPSDFILAVADSINEILRKRKILKKDIKGIGIGVPGFVNKNGVIYNLTNVSGWKNFPLKYNMGKKIGINTIVDNDANAMGLAELSWGAAAGFENAVCITLGTGVGGALIIDGKIFRGNNFFAGEIGHIPINQSGPRCKCGGTACLERYVGSRFIVNNFINRMKLNKNKSIVTKLVNGDFSKITPKILSDAARLNDKLAILTWKETGTYLGIALAGVINILNPQVIVIGGGVAGAGEILFDSIKSTVKKRAIPQLAKSVKIVKAKLGDDAGVIGAACLVFEGGLR